jgi:hypothetical protein
LKKGMPLRRSQMIFVESALERNGAKPKRKKSAAFPEVKLARKPIQVREV